MRRITLCFVICLSLFGALAQARALHFSSSSRSAAHKQGAHHPRKAHKNRAHHPRQAHKKRAHHPRKTHKKRPHHRRNPHKKAKHNSKKHAAARQTVTASATSGSSATTNGDSTTLAPPVIHAPPSSTSSTMPTGALSPVTAPTILPPANLTAPSVSGTSTGGQNLTTSSSSQTCTQHVTTSTFSSAFSTAGADAVLCLAPGSYGSFSGSSKASMVVIMPDVSAGASAPTGNATGDVDGNVTFSGASFSSASNITMDGITFSGDVSMAGNTHDVTLHDSLFHQHLVINDTAMANADIVINYNMFPADRTDCVGGPEGRIWPHDTTHSATPDGVLIENNNIGGAPSQCDGVQIGGNGVHIIGNWIHDFHYRNSAHTDGIQDYGGRSEVVAGNFMYNVPDCFVSYDGTSHADIENNICVNDGTQANGANPNDLDILGDNGSIITHNTVVGYRDSYNNAGGCITLGSKGGSSTGTKITNNIATCLVTDSGGHAASYTENHNMWVSSGPRGTGDVHGTPIYRGGSCASLSSSRSPFCADSWSSYLLSSSSSGYTASATGNALGAYGPGPVAPGE